MIQKKLGRRFIVNGLRTTKKMPVQLHDFSLMITMPVLVPVKSFSVSPTTLQLSDMMVEKKTSNVFLQYQYCFKQHVLVILNLILLTRSLVKKIL